MTTPWAPESGREKAGRIEVGDRIGDDYAIWLVTEVTPIEDFDLDPDTFRRMNSYRPEHREQFRPYHLVLAHVAGPVPAGVKRLHDGTQTLHVTCSRPDRLRGQAFVVGERFQTCSCHGDPWPCRDVVLDRVVAAQAQHLDALTAKRAGCCWACGEPIRHRQKTVAYPGDNLVLPGGPPVRFHTRRACWWGATKYEKLWLAADPRRERILTWPDCPGSLTVHHDGSSECHDGTPDCAGHLTHNHNMLAACYRHSGCCPRGCSRNGHPGTRTTPRPERRDQATLTSPAE